MNLTMFQPLEWIDSYSVAHPGLDAEHREIMRAIDRIAAAGGNHGHLRPLLCELKERTSAHFAHESAILREIVAATSSSRQSQKFVAAMSQALIDEHIAEHDVALTSLEFMIRRTLSENSQNVPAIGQTLTHWFVNHAVKHDSHLKTLFQTIRTDCPDLLKRLD
jgi:hemerythrin